MNNLSLVPTVSMTELRRETSRVLDEVSKGKVYALTRYGKVVAYLVPPEIVHLLGGKFCPMTVKRLLEDPIG